MYYTKKNALDRGRRNINAESLTRIKQFVKALVKINTFALILSTSIDTQPIINYKACMNKKSTFLAFLVVLVLLGCNLPVPLLVSSTPTPSNTPTLTATTPPTLAPTPTLTPTPLPAARLESADQALAIGDYEQALQKYQSALSQDNPQAASPDIIAAATLGVGRAYYLMGSNELALDTLRTLVGQYPDSPSTKKAYFFLGQIYYALQRYTDAADAYQQYLKLSPGIIDAYIQELIGDALAASGDYAGAISAYQNAYQAPHLGSADLLEVKIGRTYALSHDYASAISLYQAITASSTDDSVKAQVGLLQGQAYMALGQVQDAYNSWSEIVTRYPSSYDSYSALVALVNANVPVSDLDRGLVDYFAGQYKLSVEAFDRYLSSNQISDGTILYYKGLALRSSGEQEYPLGSAERDQANAQGGVADDLNAIAIWQQLINTYPTDRFASDASDDIIYTQWVYMDQPKLAAQTLLDFVSHNPGNSRAAESLFSAGRYLERAGLLDEAAKTWERLGVEYPSAPETYSGLFFAGVTHFRQNDFAGAQADFQHALVLATTPSDQSAAELWVGKSLFAQNKTADAQTFWQSAASRDPTGYYSERARELLLGQSPFTPPQNIDLAVDLPTEEHDAESWVRTTFSIPDSTVLNNLDALVNDPRILRGKEFNALGLYSEAKAEFEDLRQEVQSDPVNTFRLVQFFVDQGNYYSAIQASRQVLTLAGMNDASSLSAPIYFNHVRFGVYYKDLMLPLAQAEGFNPLLVFSLIRQESFFESFIVSSAGAHGLMQLMPATAQDIVNQLGWPDNFTESDLNRPVVNLRLGINYFARQRDAFNGDIYAMLAAYNGGPGNTSAWKALAPNDPDLFLEVVRIQETRDYIMGIAETFNIYRQIYGRTP